ncbi:MAG: mitomycin resistance protein [Gammaproteobacteria bacterium]|nr:MAG: mitomycin resistance protein [Gammaproteobacteria bacterium]
MNPNKVKRNNIVKLTDLPNIGKAMEQDLLLLGINKPSDLTEKNPYELYEDLCQKTGIKHDLCVLDVFISITRFMDGGEPKFWWEFTEERKRHIDDLE